MQILPDTIKENYNLSDSVLRQYIHAAQLFVLIKSSASPLPLLHPPPSRCRCCGSGPPRRPGPPHPTRVPPDPRGMGVPLLPHRSPKGWNSPCRAALDAGRYLGFAIGMMIIIIIIIFIIIIYLGGAAPSPAALARRRGMLGAGLRGCPRRPGVILRLQPLQAAPPGVGLPRGGSPKHPRDRAT